MNEESFRYLLWDHRPLTDFWHTGPAIARRLEHHGIHTMGELARISLQYPEILYDEFGIDAEILIDHAWGVEPCTIKNIKSYKPENSSFSEGQVLGCSYPYEKALIIIQEMADSLALSLADKHLVTDGLTLDISYGRENYTQGAYQGQLRTDHYGRSIPKNAHGSVRFHNPTNLGSQIIPAAADLFKKIADPSLTVHRVNLTANRIVQDEGIFQADLFTDTNRLEKEKQLQEAMLDIKKKFGKNAVLRGTSYLEGATMRERNTQIGGHKAE